MSKEWHNYIYLYKCIYIVKKEDWDLFCKTHKYYTWYDSTRLGLDWYKPFERNEWDDELAFYIDENNVVKYGTTERLTDRELKIAIRFNPVRKESIE